MTHLGFMV